MTHEDPSITSRIFLSMYSLNHMKNKYQATHTEDILQSNSPVLLKIARSVKTYTQYNFFMWKETEEARQQNAAHALD